MNKNDNQLTRKDFFKKIGSFTLIPAAFLWYSSAARGKAAADEVSVVKIGTPVSKGTTFKGDVIINRDDRGVKIFSSRCTHLGCRLSKIENDEIVCSCHGSRFSKDGKLIKGPADRDLDQLEYRVDKSSKEIIINVPA